MSEDHSPAGVVVRFISAWPEGDAAALASYFSDDAVYHNIPLEAVRGREAISEVLAGFMAMGGTVDVDVAHIVSDGPIVMVERVDHFVRPERTISVPMAGVFEVRNGLIGAWRDYFDLAQAT